MFSKFILKLTQLSKFFNIYRNSLIFLLLQFIEESSTLRNFNVSSFSMASMDNADTNFFEIIHNLGSIILCFKNLDFSQIYFILKLAQSNPKGISDKDVQQELPDLLPKDRAAIINKLLTQGFIELFNKGKNLIYKAKDASKNVNVTDNEETVVYRIIEEAGKKSIWTRDIRYKSNLSVTLLKKILKSLESKKLIKTVTSVTDGKKKMYMLYNLEPDGSLTGGTWYTGQDFESEFVEVLNQQCYRFLKEKYENSKGFKGGPIAKRNMSCAKSSEVLSFINNLGISKQVLSTDDIETILETLVYDGKVEKKTLSDGTFSFRACESLMPTPGLVQVPCGVCPVIKSCNDYGSITPKKCIYLKEWLEF